MGFEPTTFCMASRRSSQLSYIRAGHSIAAEELEPDRGWAALPAERLGKRERSAGRVVPSTPGLR
jgi:hypothetical protein